MHKQLCAAEFTAKFQVMATDCVAEVIGNVPGGVRPAQGRRFPYASILKAVDLDVWRTKVLRADPSVEPPGGGILVVASVVEILQEIIHTEEDLIGHSVCEGTAQHCRPVLLAAGNRLEIVGVDRAGVCRRIPTTDKAADEETLRGVDRPIYPGNPVVALVIVGSSTAEVLWGSGGARDGTGPKIVQGSNHHGVDRDVIVVQERGSLGDPGGRGNRGLDGVARDEPLAFHGEEEERLILDKRPPDGESEVVVAQLAGRVRW